MGTSLERIRSLFRGEKGAAMVHANGASGGLGGGLVSFSESSINLPASTRNYAAAVGDGLGSSVLAGPLNFIMRTFPEAPPLVQKRGPDGLWEAEPGHELERLLRNPNPYYGGRALAMATSLDFSFGNAYWVKIRNAADEVIQLWWTPRQLMMPRWPSDGSEFISHYDYMPGGRTVQLKPRDVVHLRFGLDPRNPRLGLSPLGALMREIGIDDEAANFTASILKNLGIIGVIVSPKEKAGAAPSKTALEEVKDYIAKSFTGEKRGQTLALGAPTDVQVLQYNLQGFDMGPLRDVSEERVCAAIGIPAAVVGFGTGLQQTKVGATMREMRQLAWTGGIIPMQETIAEDVDRSLLTEFEEDAEGYRLVYDTTQVRALWEDQNEKHDRIRKDALAGIIKVTVAQRLMNYTVDPDRDVYLQPTSLIALTENGQTVGGPPAPTPLPAGDPNASA